MAEREPWHLDKRVPIAFIFAIFLQTATAGWFVASIDGRIAQNTKDIELMRVERGQAESRVRSLEDKIAAQSETLARMEERFIAVIDLLNRIESRLENKP